MDKLRWKAVDGALKGLTAGLLVALSSAAGAQGLGDAAGSAADRAGARHVDRWRLYIREASARFGIPDDWIRRVIRAESGGRTVLNGRPITSRAGAMGLMQLMPGTWIAMRAKHRLGPDPHDPRDNILAGTAYLRAMYDRFGHPGAFAAYNAGPARYSEHLATGRRLPSETVAYVAAVGSAPDGRSAASSAKGRSGGIFFSLRNSAPRIEAAPWHATPPSLFVPLSSASAPFQ